MGGDAMTATASWADFETAAPALAAIGRRLLYRGEAIAAGFLATVAPDGGPRVHPVFPVIADGDLWLFIVNLSPKYRDLVANGRYALHSLSNADGGDEFYLRGRASERSDPAEKAGIVAATGGRQGAHEFEVLFRCRIEHVLHTRWEGWGTAATWPSYEKWRA
jgi:hypothetical protein